MRISIDALGANTGGNITILNNLLFHFSKIENLKIVVYIQKNSYENNELYKQDNIIYSLLSSYNTLLKKLIWQQFVIQNKSKKNGSKLILSITNTGSLFPIIPTYIYFHQSLLFVKNRELMRYFNIVIFIKFKIQFFFVIIGFLGSKKVICQTKTVKSVIIKKLPFFRDKITYYYPGICLNIFDNNKNKVFRKFNFTSFLYISHPAEYKNYKAIFQAAKILKEKNISVLFVLTLSVDYLSIKNKRYRSFIKDYVFEIEKLGIKDYFYFTGEILGSENIYSLIKSCDCIINPSFIESFPQSYLEGMNFGKPFISADKPYAREICGDSSLFFNPDDPKEFADMIEFFIKERNLKNQLSINSSKRLNYFEPESKWQQLFNFITSNQLI